MCDWFYTNETATSMSRVNLISYRTKEQALIIMERMNLYQVLVQRPDGSDGSDGSAGNATDWARLEASIHGNCQLSQGLTLYCFQLILQKDSWSNFRESEGGCVLCCEVV